MFQKPLAVALVAAAAALTACSIPDLEMPGDSDMPEMPAPPGDANDDPVMETPDQPTAPNDPNNPDDPDQPNDPDQPDDAEDPDQDGPDESAGFDPSLALFSDPESDFQTTDVHDIDEEIVRFDVTTNSIVWALDDIQEGGYPVEGNLIGANGAFEVRFGTIDGGRRAYFTEVGPATICDIRAADGRISIFPTSTTVPEHTAGQ